MWILGSVNGVTVDAQDHIWVTHAGVSSLQNNEKGPELKPPQSTCCFAAPQVLEFDAAGNLISQWGGAGQGYNWPSIPHGIAVDSKGNVIIGGSQAGHIDGRPDPPPPAGRGGGPAKPVPLLPHDAHVLKFTRTGQFVWQIGKPATVEGSNSTTTLNRPVGFDVDEAANEIYVADGLGNRRVLVVDAATGAYKRHWGAYGGKPDDGPLPAYNPNPSSNAPLPRQFQNVGCVKLSRDGMVYVCDRQGDRIQVFQKDGKFVKEAYVSPATTGEGSVWNLALSRDPQAAIPLRRRWTGQEDPRVAARYAGRRIELRPGRASSGHVLRSGQHRRRFEGQRLYRRDIRRQTRAEVHLQGIGPGFGLKLVE